MTAPAVPLRHAPLRLRYALRLAGIEAHMDEFFAGLPLAGGT
jgi:hypothetical protein